MITINEWARTKSQGAADLVPQPCRSSKKMQGSAQRDGESVGRVSGRLVRCGERAALRPLECRVQRAADFAVGTAAGHSLREADLARHTAFRFVRALSEGPANS